MRKCLQKVRLVKGQRLFGPAPQVSTYVCICTYSCSLILHNTFFGVQTRPLQLDLFISSVMVVKRKKDYKVSHYPRLIDSFKSYQLIPADKASNLGHPVSVKRDRLTCLDKRLMSPESVTRLQLETSTSATPVNLLQTTWNLDGSVTCVLVVSDLKNVDKLLVSAKYFVLRKVAPSKERTDKFSYV